MTALGELLQQVFRQPLTVTPFAEWLLEHDPGLYPFHTLAAVRVSLFGRGILCRPCRSLYLDPSTANARTLGLDPDVPPRRRSPRTRTW
jgi:hypothetical protein